MDNRIRELATAGYFIFPENDKFVVEFCAPGCEQTWSSWGTYAEAVDGAWAIYQDHIRPTKFTATARFSRGLGVEYIAADIEGTAEEVKDKALTLFEAKLKDSKLVIHEIRVRPKV